MANYNDLITAIDSVIKTNNRREITGQLLQNVLNTMVGSLGENYQLAGFATPTTNPHQPDQNVFYVASQAGVYTQFDNIVLGDGISFLMWKNGVWTSQTISMVTQSWVQQNYVSKEWFRKVFRVYDEDGLEIVPNDMDSVVDNIKAMVGLWTNEYLSALGMGRDGGGTTQTLAQLNDVQLGTLANGDALVYNTAIHKWENKQIQTGVDMSVVWAALAANTNEQINASHLATALSGYVTSANLSTMLNDYATKAWAGQNFITVEWFDKLFQLYNGTEAEANKIAPNGALPVDQTQLNIEAMFGFWTKKYISALGQGDDGSAGSGDVTWELLASQATNGRFIHPSYLTQALAGYATQSWVTSNFATISQINALEYLNQVTGGGGVLKLITNKSTEYDVDLSHEHSFLELLDRPDTLAGYGVTLTADDIPMLTKSKISDFPTTWAWSAVTGKPNSIAGYGILDAKIENGVITLGGNSITPLISETYRGTVVSVGLSVPIGFSVSGTPITDSGTLAIAFASGYEGFTTDLKNKINALFSWFEVDANGNIKTKDYTDGGTTKHRGFYSPSFISALGMGDDGQAGQGDVTWALLASPATDGRTIHSSYIAAALAGYATQNWVQQQGYITSAQLSALEYLQTITGGDEVVTFTTNKGTETILDFSHEHSWFELLDKPDTIAGLGVALAASDIPNLDWSKITTGKPSTLAGYGITDAVAFVAINGVNYSPVSGVVTLPVYTSTQVDALARLKTLALSDNGVLSFTHQDDSTTLVDFTHEHSFLELLDRPDTIKGYGITDAITTANIGSQSVNYATSAGSAGSATTAGSTNKLTTLADITWGANYLQFKDLDGNYVGNSASAISNPTADWYHHIVMNHGNSAGYFVDMAICFHSNEFYYRRIANGSANNWVRVIDSSNIGSQSVSSASSAGYATSAGNADTVDGYHYSSFLLVSGGDMNSGARISFSGGNGYLGNASNAGWLMVQDMCSQNSAGDGVWSIRTNGNAIFQNVTSYGAVSALSDIRHKEIVRNTNLQVEQIAAMRSVIYRKKDSNDNTLYAGSIAQDWQSILPQVVSVADNDEHTQSLQYGVAALIAVITTARKVSEHERRIADLERENERLKEIINNLNVA